MIHWTFVDFWCTKIQTLSAKRCAWEKLFSWLVFVAGDENLLALKQWVNSIRLVQQHQSGM